MHLIYMAQRGLKLVRPASKQWHRLYHSRPGRGSLSAIGAVPNYKIARRELDEMINTSSRFPFRDEFELNKDLFVNADTVIETLGPLMTEERINRIETVVSKRTFNILPILEHPYDYGNVAAVCRSAEAMGFASVHVIKNPDGDKYKQSARTSAGSDKWLDVQLYDKTEDCLAHAKKLGYKIVVTHLREGSVPINEVDWTQPTAVILGNELLGASDTALQYADETVYIPMDGFVESYNVSVAAAITLWEIRRSRLEKLGYHGDIEESDRTVLKGLMFLRNKGMSKQYITHLLNRPPPDWQLFRNKGNWQGKEFEEGENELPVVVEGRRRCDYWDGEICWGEQLLFPGKKCRFSELHFPGLYSLNKGKLKHRCGMRGMVEASDINAFLKKRKEELTLVGANTGNNNGSSSL